MHSAEREQCGSRFPPSRFPGWDDGLGDGDAPPSSSVRRRLHPGFLWPPLGPFHCPLGRARRWRQLRLLRPTNLLRLLVLRCRIVMTLRATVGRSILLASGNAGGGWPCCCCSCKRERGNLNNVRCVGSWTWNTLVHMGFMPINKLMWNQCYAAANSYWYF